MTAAENIVRKWDHCELGTRVSESSFDLSHHGTGESLREQIGRLVRYWSAEALGAFNVAREKLADLNLTETHRDQRLQHIDPPNCHQWILKGGSSFLTDVCFN